MLELRHATLTVAVLGLPGLAAAWGDCDERAPREAAEDAAGLNRVEIEDVGGSVVVEDDGAGSIRIAGVDRDVRVEEDGSGSIQVRHVGGDLRVGRDGSGGIRYDDVTGEVDVPR